MLLIFIVGCNTTIDKQKEPSDTIPPASQRNGDAQQGREYLLYGDYIGSGIPKNVYDSYFGPTSSNPLERSGEAATIPYAFNIFEAPNGVEVVGGINCFGCHTNVVDGEFYIGVGNSFSDYTRDESGSYALLNSQIANDYGMDSPEWEAYKNLGESSTQIGEHIVTPFAGVNPAFSLEEAAVQYRNPQTLIRGDEKQFELGNPGATDTPPWWHIQKKNALYYNGVGRGDLAKLIMQICVVGVWDTEHAANIEAHFPDVLAYLKEIAPPQYPFDTDHSLVQTGADVFAEHCTQCHGTYGTNETYPNRLISLEEVDTDPKLALSYIRNPGFLSWLQESWFAQEPYPAQFIAQEGYMAPPLDGIWVTAPYLHNGSIPNLYTLLDSSTRPAFWRRDFESSTYDHDNVGWPYEELDGPFDKQTYNTTRSGYSNKGHTYGDKLQESERTALIEYLKTL